MRKLIVVPNLSLGIREYASVTEIERRHSTASEHLLQAQIADFSSATLATYARGHVFSLPGYVCQRSNVGKVYSTQYESKILRKGYERSSIARS